MECRPNSPILIVLHGTNLYSLISSVYFHWSSLSVSWQRIYNAFIVDKSSNHTLSLRRSASTTNFPWLSLTTNSLTVMPGTLLYSRGTDTHHRKHSLYCYVTRGTTWLLLWCYISAYEICNKGPCADTKETLPQYRCVAHTLERAHRAAAQQCLEQNRHSLLIDFES
jgi:hypothetical protein